MTNVVDLINFAIAIAGLIIAIMGLLLSLGIKQIDNYSADFFVAFFSVLFFYVGSDIISQISLTLLGKDFAPLSRIAVFGESFFSSLLILIFTSYLINCTGTKHYKSKFFLLLCFLWVAYFALLVITQFTTAIYYISADNVYSRGPIYPVLLIAPILILIADIVYLLKNGSGLTTTRFKSFMLFLVTPFICTIIQMSVYGILAIVLGTCLASMLMFIHLLKEQMDHFVETTKNQAQQQISIMSLQMRPHFIYNTMTSIYYLCGSNPEKAQQVVGEFTTYLQKNFTLVAKEEPVPFSEEFEHTKAYLAVEKVRYEKLLFIDYDITFDNFKLPPLTLQPIVENAVKHGVDPELEPLHILIKTHKTESDVIVSVEDTGPGFENTYNNDEDRAHIGLENIKYRIKAMSDGEIRVERIGDKTVVTIRIPY